MNLICFANKIEKNYRKRQKLTTKQRITTIELIPKRFITYFLLYLSMKLLKYTNHKYISKNQYYLFQ